jgi:hypothetical protein
MIAINNTLVSDLLLQKRFLCDLHACKGECCVAGDAGAPLEKEEVPILNSILPDVKPYMTAEGLATIEKKGVCETDSDGELVTPLMETGQKPCAFVYYDEYNIAKCAIEKAYLEGKTDFKKPISCHLYPIRLSDHKEFIAVNYHEWSVCKPARACGTKLDVKVYRFLKEPLVRKFGAEWFLALEKADLQKDKAK